MKNIKNAIRTSGLSEAVKTAALLDIQDMQKNKGYRNRVGYFGTPEVLAEAFDFSATKRGKEFWSAVQEAI